MKRLILSVLIIGLVVGAVFAQDDSAKKANIRIAHLSSDVGEANIIVNVGDTEVMSDTFEFGDVSSWQEVDADTYSIAVVSIDGELEDALLESKVELEAGDWITIAVIGEVEKETVAMQVLIEDYSPLDAFQARLSVFHAIPNYTPVNVIVNDVELIRYLGYPGFWGPDSDGFITFDLLAQASDIRVEEEGGGITAELDDIILGGNRHYFLAIAGVASDPQFVFVASDLQAGASEDE